MGILDDIKNSVEGTENRSQSGRDSLDTSFDDASNASSKSRGNQGLGNGSGTGSKNLNSRAGRSTNTGGSGNSSQKAGRNEGQVGRSGRSSSTTGRTPSQESGQRGSPNPQTGRPREGSTEPQVSESTRREMQSAGLTSGDSSGGMEEKLKDIEKQNDQMIQILQRIERNLR